MWFRFRTLSCIILSIVSGQLCRTIPSGYAQSSGFESVCMFLDSLLFLDTVENKFPYGGSYALLSCIAVLVVSLLLGATVLIL